MFQNLTGINFFHAHSHLNIEEVSVNDKSKIIIV